MKIKTGYSFRNAVGHIDEVLDRMVEAGYTAAPISDLNSTFAWVRWKKAALKRGLKPIFGVTLNVTSSINAKKPSYDEWSFFAIDNIREINNLIELATNQFRYVPLLTYEQANAATGVLKIVGTHSELDKIDNTDNTFLALSPSISKGYFEEAKSLGFKFIATGDNVCPRPDDLALYEILVGRGASIQTYAQHILSQEEWDEELRWVVPLEDRQAATAVTQGWLAREEWADLQASTLLRPERPATLYEMCVEGAEALGVDLSDPVYSERLQKELDLIEAKEFEDYFYIISDVVKWARKRMIVGPARGSSCGSLVCYLLRITTIDPIPFGLIFERFIDINRNDLPDIDIDFSDQKRHLVFEYMAEKYGSDHIARLGTVAMYQPRSAVTEAGGAFGIPKWKFEAALDSLIERSSGDSRALNTLEDTLKETEAGKKLVSEFPEILVATKMEGHPRHYSQHAAGIVVTEDPVANYVAVDSRTGATFCDKKDAEELNLLKIDALGLTQLSIFEDALELAGIKIHDDEDEYATFLDKLPLDDPKAFEVLNNRNYTGVFQFNGLALQGLVNQIKVDCVDDPISITALARPGPLTSGGASTWVKRKRGDQQVSYPHPLFEPYLRDTLGVVIYQEQVMEIGRKIGDLSWEDVTALRKAMSKSLGKEYFDQFGDKFKAGAVAKGIPLELTEKIWDDMCAYGAWAFNKSHSVAYGIVSYWCCWLKAHHPLEFAAATLSHVKDDDTKIQILREMAREGIDYLPADIELSGEKWTVGYKDGKKRLVGPLSNVNGIGPKLQQQILSARKRGEELPSRAVKLLTNPKTKLDSLWPIRDAFNRIMPDPAAKNIYSDPVSISDFEPSGFEQEVMVFAVIKKINPRDENEVVNVAKRGYRITSGPTTSLNLQIGDDTGTCFAKVNRFDYERVGKQIVDRGAPGKALYAIKGRCPKDFKMISVKQVRFIGMLDDEAEQILYGDQQVLEMEGA